MNAPLLIPFILLVLLILLLGVTGIVRSTLVRDNTWFLRAWVFVALTIFAIMIMYLSASWYPRGGVVAHKTELVAHVVQLVSLAMGFMCLGKFFQGATAEE